MYKNAEELAISLSNMQKARIPWHFLFSSFGTLQILPSSVKELLVGWHVSFVDKRRKA